MRLALPSRLPTLVRPPSVGLPPVDDSCFRALFQALDARNVAHLVACLLCEQRVLLHSESMGLLCAVSEALLSLLFPLCWPHVCVPILPLQLIEYLDAPVPYLMGVHTSSLATREGMESFATCVIVHLDLNKVVTPIEVEGDFDTVPEIPRVLRIPLLQRVASVAPAPPVVAALRHAPAPPAQSPGGGSPVSTPASRRPRSPRLVRPVQEQSEAPFCEFEVCLDARPCHLWA